MQLEARDHTQKTGGKRIEAEVEKDEEGRRWKRKADDKRDQYLEQRVMEESRRPKLDKKRRESKEKRSRRQVPVLVPARG